MLKINERTIEAVAALLYNTIYDLSHPSEGAWSIEERRDDPAYQAFAQGLIQAVRDNPDASDQEIIEHAVQLRKHAVGFNWDTIVIDQKYASLSQKAEEEMTEIRAFIIDPSPAYLECSFFDFDLDTE